MYFSLLLSSDTYLNAFDEAGNQILGHTAKEVEKLRESNDPEQTAEFNFIFEEAIGKRFKFKLMARNEPYNDVNRLRTNIRTSSTLSQISLFAGEALPVNYASESKTLLEKIEEYF